MSDQKEKQPERYPSEFPVRPKRYTEEIVAIDRIESAQTPDYHEGNKAAPNNNLFFEERSNPLSSKGNLK